MFRPDSKLVFSFVLIALIGGFLALDSNSGESVRGNEIVAGKYRLIDLTAQPLPQSATTLPVAQDTFTLVTFDFEDGVGGPDAQGWTSFGQNASDDRFFHVDNMSGLGGTYAVLEGTKSLWCGIRDGAPYCSYLTAPGYGNNWEQEFRTRVFSVTGDVSIGYLIQWDTEANYDQGFAEYRTVSNRWETMATYDGTGITTEFLLVPGDSLAGSFEMRFRFSSDGQWSDADGDYPTDGALIIDGITLADMGGIFETEDFEGEAQGALETTDGDWTAGVVAGYGDFASLYSGPGVVQEDPTPNNTHFWGFFDGSPDNYACGGFPSQPVVPLTDNPGSTSKVDYVSNIIASPFVSVLEDEGGEPIAIYDSVLVEFDVYQDLPLDNLVFFIVGARTITDGCRSDWRYLPFFFYGDQDEWVRRSFNLTDVVDPAADSVQVSLGVTDMCWIWCGTFGSGACHSHAPLFDNVTLSVFNSRLVATNTNDSGAGSLREAITLANASPGRDRIAFDIPGAGPHVIALTNGLPSITDPVIIDGYTQPGSSPNTNPVGTGSNADIRIAIDGTSAGGILDFGIHFATDNSVVRGLALGGFEEVTGQMPAVTVLGDNNRVEGCFIGLDASGTVAQSNDIGVDVRSAAGAVVGGSGPAARNVISGNDDDAIRVQYIGGALITGNIIGLDASGTTALGNEDGVQIDDADSTRVVDNVISGNDENGVLILSSSDCEVMGNRIGTDVSGLTAIPNAGAGVSVSRFGCQRNIIGDGTPAGRNVIAASSADFGVRADGVDTEVNGNYIGVGADGTTPLGNALGGLRTRHHNSTIDNNVIAFNAGPGITKLDGDPPSRATWSGNAIFDNTGLGIDLEDDGVTVNDPNDFDTGANELTNYPTLTTVIAGMDTRLIGSYDGATGILRVEFFANSACDGSGYGEGERYLGGVELDVTSTPADFDVTVPEIVQPGEWVTATATPFGVSSEFSPCVEAFNTPEGSMVAVEPIDQNGDFPVAMTYDSVSTIGNTLVTTSGSGPALPSGFVLGDSMFYDITTTPSFEGSITICLSYDEIGLAGPEEELLLYHYDTTLGSPDWVDITTAVDTLNNQACGVATSLSPFALVLPDPASSVGERSSAVPARAALRQNTPNPFNPTTTIAFDVPAGAGDVTITVYDVSGRLVTTLVDGPVPAGVRTVTWGGRDHGGSRVASGVYFYRMSTKDFAETRKMVLLK